MAGPTITERRSRSPIIAPSSRNTSTSNGIDDLESKMDTTGIIGISSNNKNSNNNQHHNPTDHWFEKLSSPIQFSVLVCGVFFFFGIHNYLQEAIMSIPGFRFGVMLGYLEVLG
jgi:hypothetical protein